MTIVTNIRELAGTEPLCPFCDLSGDNHPSVFSQCISHKESIFADFLSFAVVECRVLNLIAIIKDLLHERGVKFLVQQQRDLFGLFGEPVRQGSGSDGDFPMDPIDCPDEPCALWPNMIMGTSGEGAKPDDGVVSASRARHCNRDMIESG